jgi:hypothetical protein
VGEGEREREWEWERVEERVEEGRRVSDVQYVAMVVTAAERKGEEEEVGWKREEGRVEWDGEGGRARTILDTSILTPKSQLSSHPNPNSPHTQILTLLTPESQLSTETANRHRFLSRCLPRLPMAM